MKKCTKCGIDKPLTAEYYHRDSSRSSGFQSLCKVCRAEYRQNNKEKILKYKAEYYQNNKEAMLKRQEEYYQNNKEKFAEYRQNNKEKILKYHAEYYQNNKEAIAKRHVEYRQNNKEKILKYKAEYYQNNKEKILKQRAEYHIQKKAEQPACVYQIVNSVNNKIYIGETTRGELRWKQHMTSLRGKYHINPKLQADFNKFGEEVFKWSIIEEYPKDKDTLLLGEINTIDKLLREGKELYNLSLTIDQLKLLMEST